MLWLHTVVSIEFQEVKPIVVDVYNSLPPNTMPEEQIKAAMYNRSHCTVGGLRNISDC